MTETTNGKFWYVLKAISGKENQVKEYLESEVKKMTFDQYVGQVMVPMEKVVTVRPNGKRVIKEKPFLSGYVLVEARLVGDVAHKLSNSPNVIGFLADDPSHPTPLRQSEVNRLLGKVDAQEEKQEEVAEMYAVGDPVKVIVGPFTGFSGVVEEINVERKKLKVMVKIFGRKTPLELSYAQVEKE